jgi:DNA-binding NarL/FixJ family response regulator
MSGTLAPAPGKLALSRVLLVEDHALHHVMLRDGLTSRLGGRASVCACHRLDQALAALADGIFDALFTDWALPGASAAPAISRFRERFPAAPIFVYTAHVESMAAAAKLGADAVYDKADRRAGDVLDEFVARLAAQTRQPVKGAQGSRGRTI